jgi:hypothetical protein
MNLLLPAAQVTSLLWKRDVHSGEQTRQLRIEPNLAQQISFIATDPVQDDRTGMDFVISDSVSVFMPFPGPNRHREFFSPSTVLHLEPLRFAQYRANRFDILL